MTKNHPSFDVTKSSLNVFPLFTWQRNWIFSLDNHRSKKKQDKKLSGTFFSCVSKRATWFFLSKLDDLQIQWKIHSKKYKVLRKLFLTMTNLNLVLFFMLPEIKCIYSRNENHVFEFTFYHESTRTFVRLFQL